MFKKVKDCEATIMEKIKKFFSSPLKSSLFTLVLTLLVVLICTLVIKASNKLIGFADAEGIALEAAGINESDFDAYTTHGWDLYCGKEYNIYYKVYFRAEEDGTEYACVVRAKDGAVISLKYAEPEDAENPNLIWNNDKRGTPLAETRTEGEGEQ